jgi:hypothetical protein
MKTLKNFVCLHGRYSRGAKARSSFYIKKDPNLP